MNWSEWVEIGELFVFNNSSRECEKLSGLGGVS